MSPNRRDNVCNPLTPLAVPKISSHLEFASPDSTPSSTKQTVGRPLDTHTHHSHVAFGLCRVSQKKEERIQTLLPHHVQRLCTADTVRANHPAPPKSLQQSMSLLTLRKRRQIPLDTTRSSPRNMNPQNTVAWFEGPLCQQCGKLSGLHVKAHTSIPISSIHLYISLCLLAPTKIGAHNCKHGQSLHVIRWSLSRGRCVSGNGSKNMALSASKPQHHTPASLKNVRRDAKRIQLHGRNAHLNQMSQTNSHGHELRNLPITRRHKKARKSSTHNKIGRAVRDDHPWVPPMIPWMSWADGWLNNLPYQHAASKPF